MLPRLLELVRAGGLGLPTRGVQVSWLTLAGCRWGCGCCMVRRRSRELRTVGGVLVVFGLWRGSLVLQGLLRGSH